MGEIVRQFNEQKLKEASEQYERSRAEKGGLRYLLTTFGFSNFGQGNLRESRMSAAGEGDLRSNDQGLRFLIGFGFSGIGQKRMRGSRAGNEKMKENYLTGFGFNSFGQKRSPMEKKEEETDPRIGFLMGFGRMNREEKRMDASADCKDKVNQTLIHTITSPVNNDLSIGIMDFHFFTALLGYQNISHPGFTTSN